MQTGIAYTEYCQRIHRLQEEMIRLDLDAFFCYGTEDSYRNLVYLADYWPAFEVGGVLVGRSGLPLVLNATESLEYAQTNAFGPSRVRQCLAFDHSGSPILNPGVELRSVQALLDEVTGGRPVRRLGLGDYATIPYPLYQELRAGCAENAELVDCDSILHHLRMNKTETEISLIEQACILTEHAFERALPQLSPAMTQYEMQGIFASELYKNGGEGPGFAMGNFSGRMTRCSIGRNKHLRAGRGQVVTVGFGCHFGGYCGSYSRPFFFGTMPEQLKQELDFMLRVHQKLADEWLKPGTTTGDVTAQYNEYFRSSGYGCPPGAPCHGLGIMEDEEPYFQISGQEVLRPGMTIAVDNYFRTAEYGFRFEDVAVITETGARLFTNGNRDHIEL